MFVFFLHISQRELYTNITIFEWFVLVDKHEGIEFA